MQQLVDFSNVVADASQTTNAQATAASKLAQYPKVAEYFKQADMFARSGQALTLGKAAKSPIRNFAIIGNPVSEAAGMRDCGFFGNAKPNVSKSWVTHNVGDAAATLRSWGYNSTPGYAGGGWTRAQTWHPWNCGWHTFRDHALVVSSKQLREQNYSGWNPRGEPNPVLHSSGPWPYSTWPAYVYWWHNTR